MTDSLHDLDRLHRPTGTALVLGGGGSAGNAWLIGVIAGLADAGLDATGADLIIGTSAGATAAAQITARAPGALLADVLTPAARPPAAPAGPAPERRAVSPGDDHLARLRRAIAEADDAADLRRRMGRELGAATASGGSMTTRWRQTVAARLPSADWPNQHVIITAVDARTGEPLTFDRHSGVDLVDAVAASCAGGFAYGIGDRQFIDGGYRSNADNADLAAGFARVLVLSPLGGRSLQPAEWGNHLDTQVEALRADGSLVETIFPDAGSRVAFGENLMDPSTRPPAARAGFDQGRALGEPLSVFWH